MNMPKKSGYDLLGEFDGNAINQKESILVVSGTLEKDLIGKILGQGIKTFLVKPFDEPTFQDRVIKILAAVAANSSKIAKA